MQNNRTFHARRIFTAITAIGALAALLVLAGCASTTVTNMTPSTLSANPSQTYTITARVKPSASNVIPASETVKIIIGGQAYIMTKTPFIDGIYEFDYKAPAGVMSIAYYFLVEYNVSDSGIVSSRTDYSPLQRATIIDRDATGLSASRGPAGARIAITGRGFTTNDSVFFDATRVRPTLESQNSLSFFVPPLDAGRSYTVSVGDAPGKMNVGSFLIDSTVTNAAGSPTAGGYAIATNANAANAADYTTTTTTTTMTTAIANTAPAATAPPAYSSVNAGNGAGAAPVFGALGSASASSDANATPATPAPATAAAFATPAPTADDAVFANAIAAAAAPAPAAAADTAQTSQSIPEGNHLSINAPTNDITVSPTEISIYTDETLVLKFVIPRIVTGAPLLIDVTTDIPQSVIMPEVYVKVGSNVGSVTLKGGTPGKGHLYAKAAGYTAQLTIPVTVHHD